MGGLVGNAVGVIGRGFDLWIAELGALVPWPRARAKGGTLADATLTVSPSGDLVFIEASQRRTLGHAIPQIDAMSGLLDLARQKPGAAVRLRLPAGTYFERRVEIPAAAARQARSILDLNLERCTPFKMHDVYSAFTLESNADRGKGLIASQYVVKRKTADPLITKIQSIGLKVSSIDCCDASGVALPIDFLGSDEITKPRSRQWMVWATALVALAMSANWIAQTRREEALRSIEVEIAAARKTADARRATDEKIASAERSAQSVLALKANQISMVDLLNELTKLLPDDVVLESLKVDGAIIEMSGLASSAAQAVTLVERSAEFKNAALSAPVVTDPASNKERFSLRFRLRHSIDDAVAADGGNKAGPSPE